MRNPVVNFDQSELGNQCEFGEAAREIETDHRPAATEIAALRDAEWTFTAGELGPRRHALTDLKSSDSGAGLHNAGTKLVAEQLQR